MSSNSLPSSVLLTRTKETTNDEPKEETTKSKSKDKSKSNDNWDIPDILTRIFYEDNDYSTEKVQKYKVLKFIGKGATCQVYTVTEVDEVTEAITEAPKVEVTNVLDTDAIDTQKDLSNLKDLSHGNKIYAAKVIKKSFLKKKTKSSSNYSKLRREIKIQKSLNHPNIVKLLHDFETDDFYVLITEYCPNDTLFNYVKNKGGSLDESEICHLMKQLLHAVKYLHSKKIMHRDIKSQNIYLDHDFNIKLGDFGLSCDMSDGWRRLTCCGTPNYIAPEVLKHLDKEDGEQYSFECDVWSIGVIMYALKYQKPPFETSSIETTFKRIKNAIYYFPARTESSVHFKDLIVSILKVDPKERPSIDTILNHSFFNWTITKPEVAITKTEVTITKTEVTIT
jgi:serine/threonine protein kinase